MSGEILQHLLYILLKYRERNREQELERNRKTDVERAALCQYVLVFDVRTEGLWDSYRRTTGAGGERGFFFFFCRESLWSQAPGTRSFFQK